MRHGPGRSPDSALDDLFEDLGAKRAGANRDEVVTTLRDIASKAHGVSKACHAKMRDSCSRARTADLSGRLVSVRLARNGSDPGIMHRRQRCCTVNGSMEAVLYVVPLLEGWPSCRSLQARRARGSSR